DASGKAEKKWKLSIHFIARGAGYYKCSMDLKALATQLRTPGWDTGIYGEGKSLRMPYCSKEDEPDRVLRRMEIENGKCQFIDEASAYLLGETYADWIITNVAGEKKCLSREKREDNVEDPNDPLGLNPHSFWMPDQVEEEEDLLDGRDYKPARDPLTLDQIKMYVGALSAKRADEYGDWCKVCWALKHEGEEQGLNLLPVLQTFAARGSNYSEADTEKRFCQRLKAGKTPVTMGTIICWAKEDSPHLFEKPAERLARVEIAPTYYDEKQQLLDTNPTEEQVQKWMLGCLRFCNVDGREDWYARFREGWREISNPKNFPFSTMSSNSKFTIETTVKGKQVKGSLTFTECLSDLINTPAFNQCKVRNVRFFPYFKEEECPSNILNRFDGWEWPIQPQEEDADIKLFNDHIRMLFGNTADYFLKLMAHKVQFPRVKVPMVVAYSQQEGAGKSSIEEFLTGVIGKKYVLSTTGTKEILGEYNSLCENTLLTFINEGKQDGKSILDSEAFKSRVTEIAMPIRAMYKNPRPGENWSMYLMWTNNLHAILVCVSDRRTVLIKCNCEKVGDHAYFNKLRSIFTDEVYAKYLSWLGSVDLTGFNPKQIPETEMREKAKAGNLGTACDHIQAICEGERDRVSLKKSDIFSIVELFEDYTSYCAEMGIPKLYTFIRKRYSEQLEEKLNLVCDRHDTKEGRKRGFLFDRDTLQDSFRSLMKNKKFTFADNS